MRRQLLSTFLADVSERKVQRGLDMGRVQAESCRNKGENRTSRKATMLDRAEARAKAAGKPFVTSYR